MKAFRAMQYFLKKKLLKLTNCTVYKSYTLNYSLTWYIIKELIIKIKDQAHPGQRNLSYQLISENHFFNFP